MATERKCTTCGTWNSTDTCSSCGAELNPKRLRVQKIRAVEAEKALRPPSKLELFLQHWKASQNPFFKMTYWIGYSVWVVYMAILSFIAFMAAWGPG